MQPELAESKSEVMHFANTEQDNEFEGFCKVTNSSSETISKDHFRGSGGILVKNSAFSFVFNVEVKVKAMVIRFSRGQTTL